MIVGDRDSFAIESAITEAIPSHSQRGLGYFVIYVRGRSYGVKKPDASMLGCSFEEVKDRLGRRGAHQIPLLSHLSATVIVEAFLDAIHRETTRDDYFGMTESEFGNVIHASKVQWAPDGDEAFDDGSFVLQFDVENRVRLIAFRHMMCAEDIANSISEHWIDSDIFYNVLSDWSQLFAAEWSSRHTNVNTQIGLN